MAALFPQARSFAPHDWLEETGLGLSFTDSPRIIATENCAPKVYFDEATPLFISHAGQEIFRATITTRVLSNTGTHGSRRGTGGEADRGGESGTAST